MNITIRCGHEDHIAPIITNVITVPDDYDPRDFVYLVNNKIDPDVFEQEDYCYAHGWADLEAR